MIEHRNARVALIADREHYEELVQKLVAEARVSVWIGTANVKEMMLEPPIGTVARAKKRWLSILETISDLSKRGVEIRILHAGVPSRAFRAALGKEKIPRLEMRRCPRVHLKMIAVDGAHLYLGSANFTGAGLGAKGDGRRNFEMGFVTSDDVFLDRAQARFDRIWRGKECGSCRLRGECPKPLDRQ